MSLYDNRWTFWTFQRKPFSKNCRTVFWFKGLRLKTHHSHTKLTYQKPVLRQTEWWVQNEPITKNEVLPANTLFFWKFCFILRTSYKEFIWCTNNPNAHIPTFYKHWSFIWRSFSLWVSLIIPLPFSLNNGFATFQNYFIISNKWQIQILKEIFPFFLVKPAAVILLSFIGFQSVFFFSSKYLVSNSGLLIIALSKTCVI